MNLFVNPEERKCGNCTKFQQHYALNHRYPYIHYPVNSGFCRNGQTKHRAATSRACDSFDRKDDEQ